MTPIERSEWIKRWRDQRQFNITFAVIWLVASFVIDIGSSAYTIMVSGFSLFHCVMAILTHILLRKHGA